MSPAIVTLLTDFGAADTYVGQMKGVMLGIDPTLRLVDLTHQIPAQDVLEAAFQLATAVDAFPPGTVHLAVVDPGVGTARRAVALRSSRGIFVGPDNGLFSFVMDGLDAAHELTNPSVRRTSVTATFHGRDLFAPTAAQLASYAIRIEDVGPVLVAASLVRLDVPDVAVGRDSICGPVVSIDHFGNCLTLMRPEQLPARNEIAAIECGEFRVDELSRTYGDVAPGGAVAVIGSFGTLELAERNGNAAERWRLKRGDVVRVRRVAGS